MWVCNRPPSDVLAVCQSTHLRPPVSGLSLIGRSVPGQGPVLHQMQRRRTQLNFLPAVIAQHPVSSYSLVSFYLKYFWCRTWGFVVACVHTHGVSTHTSYTVLYQAEVHSFRYSSGRTLLTVRFLSVAKGGNCAQTEANLISRGRQIRGLFRDIKQGSVLRACHQAEESV